MGQPPWYACRHSAQCWCAPDCTVTSLVPAPVAHEPRTQQQPWQQSLAPTPIYCDPASPKSRLTAFLKPTPSRTSPTPPPPPPHAQPQPDHGSPTRSAPASAPQPCHHAAAAAEQAGRAHAVAPRTTATAAARPDGTLRCHHRPSPAPAAGVAATPCVTRARAGIEGGERVLPPPPRHEGGVGATGAFAGSGAACRHAGHPAPEQTHHRAGST